MRTLITVANRDFRRTLFSEEALNKLASVSDVDWVPEGEVFTSDMLTEQIARYDAVITTWGSPKLTEKVLARASRLKYVGHAAGTVVPIVEPNIFDREPVIMVTNANYALARSTAELTMMLMMAGAWNLRTYTDQLQRGHWRNNSEETVLGLYGQTIGLIGYGEISKELIRLLKPFNVTVLMYSRNCPDDEAEQLGIEKCGLDELLQRSSIVSLHNTLTAQTRGMIGREQLKLMHDGALLVNTARGPIVQEQALLEELQSGRIFAALDVFDTEPVPVDHPLLRLPNALCSPHIGALSGYWKSKLGETVIDDLIRMLRGEPLEGRITKEKFAILTPK